MAWYRLYRPKKVRDLDISSVQESLQRMMTEGKIPQSLLFAGPKGTGKTSAARILGAMLNDPVNADLVDYLYFKKSAPKKLSFVEPDDQSDFARRVYEGHSFVVQELDAASNRRIDDIRLLKERINLPPSDGKMTVYILDEVHMLTNEAFNALLKILEEPPAHVVFILATTELHKLPATIISRCSVINFRKANGEELKHALERVLKAEKIKFAEADLKKIASRADGSFRDGVKILEMACSNGQLDLTSIQNLLACDNETHIKNLLQTVMQKDEQALSTVFEALRANNYNQKDFYKDLFEFLHQDLLRNLSVIKGMAEYSDKIDQFFLKEFLSIDLNQDTPVPFLVLELKLLDIIERSKKPVINSTLRLDKNKTKQSLETSALTVKATQQESSTSKKKIQKTEIDVDSQIAFNCNGEISRVSIDPKIDVKDLWQNLIKILGVDNFSLSTLLKSCKLDSLSEGIAKVFVYYSFHKEQLEQNRNRELLSKTTKELIGVDLRFDFVLQSEAVLAKTMSDGQDSDLILAVRDSLL